MSDNIPGQKSENHIQNIQASWDLILSIRSMLICDASGKGTRFLTHIFGCCFWSQNLRTKAKTKGIGCAQPIGNVLGFAAGFWPTVHGPVKSMTDLTQMQTPLQVKNAVRLKGSIFNTGSPLRPRGKHQTDYAAARRTPLVSRLRPLVNVPPRRATRLLQLSAEEGFEGKRPHTLGPREHMLSTVLCYAAFFLAQLA